MHTKLLWGALALGLVLGRGATAQAPNGPQPRQPTTIDTSAGGTAQPGQERGWEQAPGMEPEDAVLLLPRVVLAVPRYVLTAVFWPIGGLLEVVERHHVVARVARFFLWNDAGTFGWYPMISVLSSEGVTAGLTLFHSDLLGHGESLAVSGRFGGRYLQSYEVAFEADRLAGSRVWLEAVAAFEANPSLRFDGINAPQVERCDTPNQAPTAVACETHFSQERVFGLLRTGYTFGHIGDLLQLGVTTLFDYRDFARDDAGERSIEEVYRTAAIPGFDGATTAELDGNLIFDGRASQGLDSRGVYLELFGGYAPPLWDWSYWHYGAALSTTIDLFRTTRLLTLGVALEAVHGEDGEIPFTHLPRLGGSDRLRGYAPDQLRGEVAGVASAEYHYPIHKNVLGSLFFDAGYVAGTYGDLFADPGDWKLGGGGGLIVGGADDVLLRFELAYGDGLQVLFSTDLPAAFADRSAP